LREAHPQLTARGAQIVAIAPDTVEGLKTHLKTNTYPYTLLADPDGATFDAYDVTSRLISLGQQPGLFVVAADGTIAFDAIGDQQWDLVKPAQLAKQLEQLGA
jgi:peroxiredoxin